MRRLGLIAGAVVACLSLVLVFSERMRVGFLRLALPPESPPRLPLWAPAAPPAVLPVRVAAAAMVSPTQTFRYYPTLFRLVAKRVGVEVELVQRKTYREVNELLRSGEVEVAWICTGAWPELAAAKTADLLVVPVVGGKTSYRSYLVVREGSPYRQVGDLRGARIAYSDSLSLTGCRIPQLMVRELGFAPETFFSSSFFTFSHDNSLQAVGLGLADVAGVDSLVYEFLKAKHPDEVRGLRILAVSRDLPIPPVVVARHVSPARMTAWKEAFLTIHTADEGKAVLAELGIDRFVPADPRAYEGLP